MLDDSQPPDQQKLQLELVRLALDGFKLTHTVSF